MIASSETKYDNNRLGKVEDAHLAYKFGIYFALIIIHCLVRLISRVNVSCIYTLLFRLWVFGTCTSAMLTSCCNSRIISLHCVNSPNYISAVTRCCLPPLHFSTASSSYYDYQRSCSFSCHKDNVSQENIPDKTLVYLVERLQN